MLDSSSTAVLDVETHDVESGVELIDHPLEPEDPFRILMLGDFSGRAARGIRSKLATRKPILIDRDNFDDVVSQLLPELKLGSLDLRFGELEDFHPDAIYRQAHGFQEPPARPLPFAACLLDQIVEQHHDPATAQPVQSQSSSSEAMLAILHDPSFQALEAAWRAVFLLVRRLNTDADLKLYLLDATLEEIVADPAGFLELVTSARQKWALLVGNFMFGQSRSDARILEFLAGVARRAEAPFLAAAQTPGEAVSPEWEALRDSREAPWVGLALPRFLLRLPYGKDTSPIESFPFEEMPESVHQHYLWGNPAFLCACLIAQSFLREGWALRPGSVRRLDGMPAHVYREDGESVMKPCAEVLMTERQASQLMEQGHYAAGVP